MESANKLVAYDLDNEDLLNFNYLSKHLITGAASANKERNVGDVDNIELPPTVPNVPALPHLPTIMITIGALVKL